MKDIYLLEKKEGVNKYNIVSSGNDSYNKPTIKTKHVSHVKTIGVLAKSIDTIIENMPVQDAIAAGTHYNAMEIISETHTKNKSLMPAPADTKKKKEKKKKKFSSKIISFEVALLYSKKFQQN